MKICTFEGCKRKYAAKGYCKVHNNILKKEGALRIILAVGRRINPSAIRLCSVEGCQRKHEAKGYCKAHWSQQHYTKKIGEIRVRNHHDKICKVDDCTGLSRALGYCMKHYTRYRTNGTTELIPRHIVRKKCLHAGCYTNKFKEGYCFKHYREDVLKLPGKPRGGHNKKEKVKCDIENCDRHAKAKGWCEKHYGRYRRNGDPLTCYRRPKKSKYVSLDNILNATGTFSKAYDAEILRENFIDNYDNYDNYEHDNYY